MNKLPFVLLALLTINLAGSAQKLVVDSLSGKVKTYYSPGRLNRAKATQQLIQDAVAFYEAQFPGKSFSVPLYVVDKVQVPFYDDSTNYLAVGSISQRMAAPRLLAATPNSPTDTVDLIAVHELGHYFLTTLHQAPIPVQWANEFFATYFAICYLQTKNISLISSDLTGIPRTYRPIYRSLADFERLYYKVGGANYGWYQEQFARLGYALYPKFKTRLVQIAIDEYGHTGKKTPPMGLLPRLAPQEMKAWLQGLQN